MSSLGLTKPTNCTYCGYLCAFNAQVEDGKVIALQPDPSRYPYDERVAKSCRRWRLNIKRLEGEHRVNYPLKRKGERGSGAWEQVSWDAALDDIAAHLRGLIQDHGPQTLASAIGGPHGNFWPLHRFMNLVGSPNNMGIGQICWNPRIWMDVVTFGWSIEPDLDPDTTGALFLWGTNPSESDNSLFWSTLQQLSQQEIPLVVIDPRYTKTARIADLWLPIRPGTDCTLALALVREIIEHNLVDQEFVDTWCHGYEELVAQVSTFTPEYAAEVCGLNAEDITRAALLFGKAQAAALISGRGIDQIGPEVAPTHRAICCLRAITANIDVPGACLISEMSDFTPEVDLEMSDHFSQEQQQYCLNTAVTPLQSYEGYHQITRLTLKHGRRLPLRYLTSAHPDLVLQAMETGEPYPIRALIVEGTNPLLTYADTHRVQCALESLDLLVVLEQDMTSTACMADYVLPIAGSLERPTMQIQGGIANCAYGGPAAVAPYYERRTDYEVFRELGLRFGQEASWPEESLEEAFAASLASADITWEQFCAIGYYAKRPAPLKHERLDTKGTAVGFATATGKIELASESLTALGGQRLPMPSAFDAHQVQGEPGNLSSSIRDAGDAEVSNRTGTVTLLTGARKQPYNASVFHDEEAFRKTYPRPIIEMSENTAREYQLKDDDEVQVQTQKGTATFWVKTIPMRDNVVSADYGWWNPTDDMTYPVLGGIDTSNINQLTSCSARQGEPMIGTWSYNAIECKLLKKETP